MKKLLLVAIAFALLTGCSTTNSETMVYKDLTKIINNLYSGIIIDYQGVPEERIIQDFGQPNSKGGAEGFIDGTPWSENHLFYNYEFNDGSISFYINKNTNSSDYTYVFLKKQSDIKILVPGLINKGDAYPDIILGKSTFGNIFEIMNSDSRELRNVLSYQGGSAGNDYTNLDFYFGKYGKYHEFTFGIPGLYNEEINQNYKILSDEKPQMVFIK